MKTADPIRELARRTATGEIVPIPPPGPRDRGEAERAAIAQLRLRGKFPDAGPVPRMLGEVRRVFSEFAVCPHPEALARILPGDSFPTLLATQDDDAGFSPYASEILALGSICGRLADEEFFDCRTIVDLVANMERAEREGRAKVTPGDIRRHNRNVRIVGCLCVSAGIVAVGVLLWWAFDFLVRF
jgi:hypothetical protein